MHERIAPRQGRPCFFVTLEVIQYLELRVLEFSAHKHGIRLLAVRRKPLQLFPHEGQSIGFRLLLAQVDQNHRGITEMRPALEAAFQYRASLVEVAVELQQHRVQVLLARCVDTRSHGSLHQRPGRGDLAEHEAQVGLTDQQFRR